MRWLARGMVAVLICAAPAGAQDRALPIYRGSSVEVHSDADRETAIEVARHMDRAADAYMQWFRRGASRDVDARARIYLLNDQRGYAELLAARGIDATGTAGMFFRRRGESAMAGYVHGASYMHTLRTLQHEGFHQFASEQLGDGLPRWLDEGLAGYFEHSILTRTRFITGLVPAERADYLHAAARAGELLPLAELFALTPTDWTGRVRSGHGSVRAMYWQSWSVVHFLMHADRGRHEGAFRRMLTELAGGASYAQAERTAFGAGGIAALEQRWLRYVREEIVPDQLATTADRLEFIAAGMRAIHEQAPERMPDSLDDLGDLLRAARFTMVLHDHAIRIEKRADDPRYFPPDGAPRARPAPAQLRLIAPASKGLPPSVVSEGVRPSLRLVWTRDNAGRLRERMLFE